MNETSPSQGRVRTIHRDYSHIYRYMRGIALVAIGIWIGITIFSDNESYLTNVFTEGIGIIATYFIFDEITKRSAKQELKQQLLEDLKSRGITPAVNALDRLRRESWLDDKYFVDEDLNHANWERAYIGELNLERINLTHANLSNASCLKKGNYFPTNFQHAKLDFATIENAILDSCNFHGASLDSCNLKGASLIEANLNHAELCFADLSGANMAHASIKEANLDGSILQNANLRYTVLIGSRLKGTELQGADLDHTNMEGTYMEDAQINEAHWQATTILPDAKLYSKEVSIERYTDRNHPEFLETLFDINEVRKSHGIDFLIPMPWGFMYHLSEVKRFYVTYWNSIHDLHQKKRLSSEEIKHYLDNFNERFSSAAEEVLSKFE